MNCRSEEMVVAVITDVVITDVVITTEAGRVSTFAQPSSQYDAS